MNITKLAVEAALLLSVSAVIQPASGQIDPTSESLEAWLENDQPPSTITQAERAAFTALATDEERFRFIEQFWLRRGMTMELGSTTIAADSITRPGDAGPIQAEGNVVVTITGADGATVTMRADRMTIQTAQ